MFNQGPGKKSSSSKEGLSLYGVFHHFAHTPQGRNRLRQDFLRPSVNMTVIQERHDFIGVFLRPDNCNSLNKISKSLKHIKNLRPVMINLRKGVSTGSAKITGFKTTVWATLLAVCGVHTVYLFANAYAFQFAFYGIDIQDSLKEVAGGDALVLRMRARYYKILKSSNLTDSRKALRIFDAAHLHRIGRMIQEIVRPCSPSFDTNFLTSDRLTSTVPKSRKERS